MTEHPELTADWKVVFDARGHLIEPHTGRSVPLGTSEVAGYLDNAGEPDWLEPSALMPDIETCGPRGCYGAVLFCEKEGFNELFAAVDLAERYDIAIMSTKGLSVTASRRLVDRLCYRYQIPLFVMHDFYVSGLTILRTLRSDTRRYGFENEIEVIDLGLRLTDVQDLESDAVTHDKEIEERLKRDGATAAEIEFLKTKQVELNAFTSDALIQWVEGKLMMVPSAAPLVLMFARANRQKGGSRVVGSAGILPLGYLLVWIGFSVMATLAQWRLHAAAVLSPMMASTSSILGGVLLVAAGIFQFTPLKRACLVRCRSPLTFLMSDWREGQWGAFVMGLKHGAYCVGLLLDAHGPSVRRRGH